MMTNLLHGAHVANKLFSTIARLRLLLVMFVALSVSAEVWGAETETLKWTNYTSSGSGATLTITWTGNTSCQVTQSKGDNTSNNVSTSYATSPRWYQYHHVTFTPQTGCTITKVVLTGSSASYNGQEISFVTGTGSISKSNNTTTITGSWTSAFKLKMGKQFRPGTVVVTYETSGSGSTTVDPEVTFSNGEYTIGGAALDLSTLWESNSTGAVTYSVTNAGSTGAIINGTYFTATAAGQCTVQASQAKTASHNAITKTATITVNAAAGGGGDGECTWQLVTDASTLKAGDEIVIAAKDYNYAISTTQNNNNRAQASITKNNNTITFENDVQIITLYEGIEVANTFLFKVKNGYLYAASSDGNHLKTTTQPNANADWYITVAASTNVATIKASGSNTRNLIRYNSSNNPPIFSCYGSGQKDVVIYKKVCTTEPTRYTKLSI